jgi:Uncharacterised nucleotidyltransferase
MTRAEVDLEPMANPENRNVGHERDAKDWRTSHLPRLSDSGLEALVRVMWSWFHQEPWELPGDCDASLMWEYVDRHGLGGALGALASAGLASPPEIAEPALHRYLSNHLHHERAVVCCRRLQEAALGQDVGLVVLKGPALVASAYGDPGLRSYSDIDLFARSHNDVVRLASALDIHRDDDWNHRSVVERVVESETFDTTLSGWHLEIRYPHGWPGEPLTDLLMTHRDRLVPVPADIDDLLDPDPDLHLVFLIVHMTVHHMFSRFFWSLDVAAFVRRNRARLDMAAVTAELSRLGLRNAGAVVSEFCRRHIDPGFPVIEPELPAWNMGGLRRMASPECIIRGTYGVEHESAWRRLRAYIYGAVGFFLIADPPRPGQRWGGHGRAWTTGRMRTALRSRGDDGWLLSTLSLLSTAVLFPLAYALGRPWRRADRAGPERPA